MVEQQGIEIEIGWPAAADISPPFASAYSKAQWATHHIEVLEGQFRAYLDNCVRMRIEQPHGPDGEKVVHIETSPLDQRVIALLIGDAMRNLRDALDHAISGIFRKVRGDGSDDRVHFPTGHDRNDLVGRVDGTFVDTRLEHVSECILYEIKPTRTENFLILALNQVANFDKHRQIVVVTQILHMPMVDFSVGSDFLVVGNTIGIRPGSNFSYAIPSNANITNDGNSETALEVSFAPSEVFSSKAVQPTLVDCTKAVVDCLNRLQAAFARIS